MCVRYVLRKGDLYDWIEKIEGRRGQKVERTFERMVEPGEHFPGDDGTIIRLAKGVLEAIDARWGLTPVWANGPKYKNFGKKNAYNARSESVSEKPTFRGPFKAQRCLIPATAFYERADGRWLLIEPEKGATFAIAGLYEGPNDASGGIVTYTMMTTLPNEIVAQAHDRMPVVLDEADYDAWLDPDVPGEKLRGLLVPARPEMFTIQDAGPVGKPKKDDGPSLF